MTDIAIEEPKVEVIACPGGCGGHIHRWFQGTVLHLKHVDAEGRLTACLWYRSPEKTALWLNTEVRYYTVAEG